MHRTSQALLACFTPRAGRRVIARHYDGTASGRDRASSRLMLVAGLAAVAGAARPDQIDAPRTADPRPTRAALDRAGTQPRSLLGRRRQALAPDPAATYTVIEIKRTASAAATPSKGPDRREWSAKFPPEAPTEVVASRIHWGVGYHQPPIYYVPKWTAEKATSPNPQLPARFREKNPRSRASTTRAKWSYYQNPFVGTRELKGLLVLQAMLGNSDLKDDNNALYQLKKPIEGARWCVARDPRAHLRPHRRHRRAARRHRGLREDAVHQGRRQRPRQVRLARRHDALFDDITPADVRWICERLSG